MLDGRPRARLCGSMSSPAQPPPRVGAEPTGNVAAPRTIASRDVVVTRGLDKKFWRDIYPFLLATSWPRLIALIIVIYLAVNAIFGFIFFMDPGGIENVRADSFADAFYFSVQTWGTIGYGRMSPLSTWAHAWVTVESILSMLSVAILTGLIFSKFSRPTARVLFSNVAVITTWDGQRSLVFRLANERGTQIVDAQISVTMNRLEQTADGGLVRRIHDLKLSRSRNPNFVFAWTVIHPIDENSPLHDTSVESLLAADGFISASVVGIDEIFNQSVYARYRYDAHQLRFGHDFISILGRTDDGRRLIDYTHFHETEPEEVDEPEAPPQTGT